VTKKKKYQVRQKATILAFCLTWYFFAAYVGC
jgi:hypothetical protein